MMFDKFQCCFLLQAGLSCWSSRCFPVNWLCELQQWVPGGSKLISSRRVLTFTWPERVSAFPALRPLGNGRVCQVSLCSSRGCCPPPQWASKDKEAACVCRVIIKSKGLIICRDTSCTNAVAYTKNKGCFFPATNVSNEHKLVHW